MPIRIPGKKCGRAILRLRDGSTRDVLVDLTVRELRSAGSLPRLKHFEGYLVAGDARRHRDIRDGRATLVLGDGTATPIVITRVSDLLLDEQRASFRARLPRSVGAA